MVTSDIGGPGGRTHDGGPFDVGISSACGAFGPSEDYCAIMADDLGDVLAVALADGCGGAPYGRVLSRLVCLAALASFSSGADGNEVFQVAAQEVRAFLRETGSVSSGTTLSFAIITRRSLRVWSVGDNLCLHVRGREARRVLEPDRVRGTNLLRSYLGASSVVDPRFGEERLRPGDSIVFATDGAYGHVSDGEVREMLDEETDAAAVASQLVDEARRSGYDDATAAVIMLHDPE